MSEVSTAKVKIAVGGRVEHASIRYYWAKRGWRQRTSYVMELSRVDGRTFTGCNRYDYFAAMLNLRLSLEQNGILLMCIGARRDVWPSGMQRDMAQGLCAAQRSWNGKNVSHESIFMEITPEEVALVEEQKQYVNWLVRHAAKSVAV